MAFLLPLVFWEHIMNLSDSVLTVRGIGEKTAGLLAKLNIFTVRDLLYAFPRDYDVFRDACAIAELKSNTGQKHFIRGYIIGVHPLQRVRNLLIMNVLVRDHTGAMRITFFNQPYLKNKLSVGSTFYFRGKVIVKGTELVMQQPVIYTEEEFLRLKNVVLPKYALTKGLTNRIFMNSVQNVLRNLDLDEEFLPEYMIKEAGLIDRKRAFYAIHFPNSLEEAVEARKRLVFEELFLFVYMVRGQKGYADKIPNHFPIKAKQPDVIQQFLDTLPYRLTGAQLRTWQEICQDLESDYCMNRLVQGDVGSGKTILAVMALWKMAAAGYQGALMAPTEVLARQHMEEVTRHIEAGGLDLRPVLLVGSMTAKQKREAYAKLKSGEANLAIGTHAVIQDKVEFQKLALVITDEQHRFGVRQREALAQKGAYPHVLVMSATPIPRSLAIILYGDMHLSVVDELPANRLPRKNCVVGTGYRPTAYDFIYRQVQQGYQAYVICPMVEACEEEDSDLENVIEYTARLQEYFGAAVDKTKAGESGEDKKAQGRIPRVAYLHGKMKASRKNDIMQAFVNHEIDVLVSTTVIEVGINVPNATVMMVENAERFGLAGLHQLRGRVGRGDAQSYCIFVSASEDKHTKERLDILNHSNDGFFVANEDLRLRGPGDLFGIRQSGEFDFKLADIYGDADILKLCGAYVERLMNSDPKLEKEEHALLKKYFITGKWNNLDFRSI